MIGGRKEGTISAWESKVRKENFTGITILIPHERAASKREVKRFIEAFLACGARVLFKVRPSVGRVRQLADYELHEREGDLLQVVENMDAIENADFVAGSTSSLLYDAVAHKKPVIYLKTGVTLDERLVANDLAEPLALEDDICAKLESFTHILQSKLLERRTKLLGESKTRSADVLYGIMEEVRQSKTKR